MVWQTRGWAGKRQVPNVKYALAHNVGLGGAVVVSLYRKGFPDVPTPRPEARHGYNPGAEARSITDKDFERARARNAAQISPLFASAVADAKAKL
jgi:sterol carrier protein 2